MKAFKPHWLKACVHWCSLKLSSLTNHSIKIISMWNLLASSKWSSLWQYHFLDCIIDTTSNQMYFIHTAMLWMSNHCEATNALFFTLNYYFCYRFCIAELHGFLCKMDLSLLHNLQTICDLLSYKCFWNRPKLLKNTTDATMTQLSCASHRSPKQNIILPKPTFNVIFDIKVPTACNWHIITTHKSLAVHVHFNSSLP